MTTKRIGRDSRSDGTHCKNWNENIDEGIVKQRKNTVEPTLSFSFLESNSNGFENFAIYVEILKSLYQNENGMNDSQNINRLKSAGPKKKEFNSFAFARKPDTVAIVILLLVICVDLFDYFGSFALVNQGMRDLHSSFVIAGFSSKARKTSSTAQHDFPIHIATPVPHCDY